MSLLSGNRKQGGGFCSGQLWKGIIGMGSLMGILVMPAATARPTPDFGHTVGSGLETYHGVTA